MTAQPALHGAEGQAAVSDPHPGVYNSSWYELSGGRKRVGTPSLDSTRTSEKNKRVVHCSSLSPFVVPEAVGKSPNL